METMIFIFVAISCIFGLTYMFNLLWLWLSKPKEKISDMIIMPINSTSKTIEGVLRYKISLMDTNAEQKSLIVVIDMGMSEENRKICRIYENTYAFFKVMTSNEFSEFINENF
ncbi:MAG: hypothetical protein RSC41_03735 [Oscillospiraceae bacterium]